MLRQQQPRTLAGRLRLLAVRRRSSSPLLLFFSRSPSLPPAAPPSAATNNSNPAITPTAPATAVRFFTRPANLSTPRPQLPFLAVPLSAWRRNNNNKQQQQFRYLTTERKRWLAHEFLTAGKYTVSLWAILGLTVAIYWSLQQEWLERRYPTPHEWTYLTRARSRLARWAPDRTDVFATDWVQAGAYAKNVLERLEDPSLDGGALLPPRDDGEVGFDATAASEPWRRGYHQILMLCGRAAEHLDDQVVDTTRHLVFPAAQVRGPSNPHPAPIAAGSPPAPREEDCDRAYDPPEAYYGRVLATRGFSARQKMDAALAHAAWLEFKGAPEAAARMYERALALAVEGSGAARPGGPLLPYDEKTYVLRDDNSEEEGRKPSANVLASLTALATHKARGGDVEAALPILISILRARRSLPSPQQQQPRRKPSSSSAMAAVSSEVAFGGDTGTGTSSSSSSSPWTMENVSSLIKSVVLEPAYPPPPDDGSAPPARDPGELCEEAGLNLYIGEIIYAMSSKSTNSNSSSSSSKNGSRSGREDGLAWTREAVDLAEEQLHKLKLRGGGGSGNEAQAAEHAKKTCKDCLESGLTNWAAMVERLAREEKEKKEKERQEDKKVAAAAKSGWLGLWGDGNGSGSGSGSGSGGNRDAAGEEEENRSVGRWEAEEQVVRERTRRARDIIEELEAPKTGIAALVWA
ncbi:hypothetical protein SLS62_003445 [Diatrype stigma]|uniref:Uncharacterized protein n=1 Tax=Diatrype stigma TaxID=117547 RepID=A0AAN9UVD4_9PEZI